MASNSIMIDLEDPRSEKIADVISNKTAKKILALLAEKEMSGSEISEKLKIPLNTTSYNIKKLVESGLVEKSKRFFWSTKGKRIEFYKVLNKRIVISPQRIIKGVIPALIVSSVLAIGIKIWTNSVIKSYSLILTKQDAGQRILEEAAQVSSEAAKDIGIAENILTIAQNSWIWFLSGALMTLLVYLLWNWWKNEK